MAVYCNITIQFERNPEVTHKEVNVLDLSFVICKHTDAATTMNDRVTRIIINNLNVGS